jgi:putative hydrolase of the HAD superfamily
MVIRAVVFDIGGVLEITPDLGVDRPWETRLGLSAGEILVRMRDIWRGGSIGTITLDDVHEALKDRLGLDDQKVAQYMADLWREYLGTANTELIEYARELRPRYRTGIVSNSFVGAREREQAAYGSKISWRRSGLFARGRVQQARSSHLRAHLHPAERSARGDDLPR